MSGHNKWSKIKHKKTATDAAKSKIFGKYAQSITAESKKVNGDRTSPTLRDIIERARKENMPMENIDRAIAKGIGGSGAEQVTYETYGPGGVALIIKANTDNRNRTAQEIKHILTEQNCQLAEPGAAAWAFKQENEDTWTPTVTVAVDEKDKERLNTLIEKLEENEDVEEIFHNVE